MLKMKKKTHMKYLKAGVVTSILLLTTISTIVSAGLIVDPKSFEYDMLILCPNIPIAKEFQRLKDMHDAEGIVTRIRVIQNPNLRTPDNVRNQIKTAYQLTNHRLKYVLIAGNDRLFPSHEMNFIDPIITDQYFACLDDPFYNDKIAEVYVGRAPVNDRWDAERFVSKTHAYYHDGDWQQLEKVLMVGEHVDFVSGKNWMEALRGDIPSSYAIYTMYEADWAWTGSDLINALNTPHGFHIINHFGHGDVHEAMKLVVPGNSKDWDEAYLDEIENKYTNDLFFVYTQACWAGDFNRLSTDPSWAEYITVKDRDGAFAVIANAGQGWYIENDVENSPSQMFHSAFLYEGLYRGERLGAANQISKEYTYFQAQMMGHPQMEKIEQSYYQTNLFGDPAITFHDPVDPISSGGPQSSRDDRLSMVYALSQNNPNPMRQKCNINYQLPTQNHVTLKFYNTLGQCVRTLVNEPKQPGYYSVIWDGRDDFGREVASGVYFYQLHAGVFKNSRKMLVVR